MRWITCTEAPLIKQDQYAGKEIATNNYVVLEYCKGAQSWVMRDNGVIFPLALNESSDEYYWLDEGNE